MVRHMQNKSWTNNFISFKEYLTSSRVNDIYKVYAFICNYIIQHPTRKFFFSFAKIGAFLSMPYQTVYSAVKRLTHDGLLSIVSTSQIVKYEGNEYQIYREIKVVWRKAKEIMSVLSVNSNAYRKLDKIRYRKLAKQRPFTYIKNAQAIYKRYIEETGYAKYKSFKQMFLEFCKNVSGKYYNVGSNLNYISLEEANMFSKEEAHIKVDIPPKIDPDISNTINQLLEAFRKGYSF